MFLNLLCRVPLLVSVYIFVLREQNRIFYWNLPLHRSNFSYIESKSDAQSLLFSLVGFMGMPKYVMGNTSCLLGRTLKMKGFILPKGMTKLLWKLILSPDQTSKYRRTHLIIMASLMSFWLKIKVSSAYYRLRDVSEEEPGKPDGRPASFEFFVILCSPSANETNNRGERGPLISILFYRLSLFLVFH